jgi:hypothetical protein
MNSSASKDKFNYGKINNFMAKIKKDYLSNPTLSKKTQENSNLVNDELKKYHDAVRSISLDEAKAAEAAIQIHEAKAAEENKGGSRRRKTRRRKNNRRKTRR